ncbi:methyl-accepting chemotaxis protein [Pelosinus sp. sgz500959]|uniref:methyl-accepting chemotaxis protein n=1 Tax=Pelosinus sp. sgz500959 TaxID=3242472 RepID=UPI00366FBB66
MFDIYKANALGHASALSRNQQIIDAAKRRDAQALFAMTTPLMRESKLDYMLITDPRGFVIMRTHEPGKIPKADDNIANQVNVSQAISGKSFVGIEEGKVVKLSVRAGAPLYDETGALVGVISTGYVISQNEIVDQAKKMFRAEFTLFLENDRVATTITGADGNRLSGTPLDNSAIIQTVLKEGKVYVGTNEIQGKNYTSAYGPLVGANGKVIGMIFSGIPTTLMEKVTQTIIAQIIGVSTFVLIIVIIIATIFLGRLLKPLQLILGKIREVAEGNLAVSSLDIQRRDEIGRLAAGFNTMLENLRQLIRSVVDSCAQVAASSEELTASAEESAQAANQVAVSINNVAHGAEEQLRVAEDTSSVVQQIATNIQQAAVNANQVSEQSAQAANKAKIGNLSINKAINQMSQIEQTVTASAQVVTGLGERSKEIGQIVDTISGIAGQTNLLALNAAIEAARAGEQGRGFAVVAEEVRKLAEQSQNAAKQIAALINEIQGDTERAVVAMNDGTREVKLGAEVVNASGKAFQEIADVVTKVSGQTEEISVAIEQMAIGSQKIVDSVKQIDNLSKKASGEAQTVSAATEEQSASMEEIASSSQVLAHLAMDLNRAVSKFKI